MKLKNEDIFELILTDIEKGLSIEELLEKHPEMTKEMKEYLTIADNIIKTPKPEISKSHMDRTINRILEISKSIIYTKKDSGTTSLFLSRLLPVLGSLVILVLVGWVSLLFSARALPGDILYPVKLAKEKIHYLLTFTPDGKANLHLIFASNRTRELFKKFNSDKSINSELVKKMLAETKRAIVFTESGLIRAKGKLVLAENIDQVAHYQKETLEKIRPLAFSSSLAIIDMAIDACCENDECIHNMLRSADPDSSYHCPASCSQCGQIKGKCKCDEVKLNE